MTEEDDLSFEALTFGASERDKKRTDKDQYQIEQDDTEEEVHEASSNVILVYTSYGGKINPIQIIEFAQANGGKVVNFNFREKQCFGFLQFEDDGSIDRVLDALNDSVIEGTQVNAERCHAITAGRDPRTHNSDSDYKNSTLVLKNLPFQLKQERLEEILNSVDVKPMNVSYLYDNNGMFRGMAFVKYKEIGQGTKVFQALNGMDINGRKLRIEYKRKVKEASVLQEDDVNHLHEQLVQFTTSPLTELSFPCVSSYQRKQIHQFAERLGLGHYSTGEGESRYVLVKKRDPESTSHPSSFNGNAGSYVNSLAASLGSTSIPISSIASSPSSTTQPSTSPKQSSGKVRRRSDINPNSGGGAKAGWESKSPQNDFSGPLADRQKAIPNRNNYNGPGTIGGPTNFYGNSGVTPPYSALNGNTNFNQAQPLYSSSPAFPSYHSNQMPNGSSISSYNMTGVSPVNYYGNVSNNYNNSSPVNYNSSTSSQMHSNHISSGSFNTPPTIGFSSNFHAHFGSNYNANGNPNAFNSATPPMYVGSNETLKNPSGSFSGSPFSQFGGPSPPFRKSNIPSRTPTNEGATISAVRQPKGPDGTGGFGSDYQRSRQGSGPSTDSSSGPGNAPWTLFGSSAPLFTMTSGLEGLRGQREGERYQNL
ncbi:hypothetical protein PROFUN_10796 [Planoprotostelium fungivorum]|uniref:Uncharacterized protein n=1 Tax=Planoprotostelium fungivorum TaxID=1890364 RepID=A0A2P6NCX5_9EUKA|nr:hypothetical protein PROFUN_10796 [Planoprotostelium fungivorum]